MRHREVHDCGVFIEEPPAVSAVEVVASAPVLDLLFVTANGSLAKHTELSGVRSSRVALPVRARHWRQIALQVSSRPPLALALGTW